MCVCVEGGNKASTKNLSKRQNKTSIFMCEYVFIALEVDRGDSCRSKIYILYTRTTRSWCKSDDQYESIAA